ncbi:phage major capsid protein [Paenibacillus albicereus]|uniref:Phage major capsid protein n=1 Tax=Paenibacillus albicereus TaxID=2726185 RepID=A0A6H2GZG5_9BACL|nr:phage major capsid protein [Paenibacillus albicereus]QJC52792.1 phage major capsid protein [Paenibacillus albicereus]
MKNQSKFRFPLNLQTFAEGAVESLAELLQARASVHDQQQAIVNKAKTEGRNLTDEEEAEYDRLDASFDDYSAKIEAAQKQEGRENKMAARTAVLNQTSGQPFRPAAVAGAPVQAKRLDNGGFQNLGEIIHAVRFGDSTGRLQNLPVGQGEGGGYGVPEAFRDQIMPKFQNQWSMGVDSEGGYAVPDQFIPDVLQIGASPSVVRPRATVIPAGDPPDSKVTMPALNQGTNGVYGGVQVQWIGEGADKPDTNASLAEVSLQPNEVAATTIVTDKLLRNWKAADSFIRGLLTKAMTAAEDIAFLTGNGTGKPTGVLGAAGGLVVKRATANKIQFIDILQMLASLLPESTSNSVFVANQSAMVMIASLKDDAGNSIFIRGDATRGLPSTLFGIPIVFTGKTPALGAKGDLMLVDLSYYLIKDGSGPFIAASEHVMFKQNKTVIKVFWNVDGKPWVVAPLTLENGVTKVSPYVILDIPAV